MLKNCLFGTYRAPATSYQGVPFGAPASLYWLDSYLVGALIEILLTCVVYVNRAISST
jgi:hypothetical protein